MTDYSFVSASAIKRLDELRAIRGLVEPCGTCETCKHWMPDDYEARGDGSFYIVGECSKRNCHTDENYTCNKYDVFEKENSK